MKHLEEANPPSGVSADGASAAEHFASVFAAIPGINLLLAADPPRFTMLLASDDRLAATMTTREATMGRPLFDVFADANPENTEASGVANLRASLETVLRTRAPHRMALQRYDLRRTDGSWEERYWSPLNVPVLGANGEVLFLLHQVTDVTESVHGQQALERSEQRVEAQRFLAQLGDALFALSDVSAVRAEATRLLAQQLGASRTLYAERVDLGGSTFAIQADHHAAGAAASAGLEPFLNALLPMDGTRMVPDLRQVAELSSSDLEGLEAAGIRACVVAPLLLEKHRSAFIAVMQSAPRAWAAGDVALIEETAERTGVAVARARAETALRESDRRKDEFLATLAHELRNPLAPVRNGVQILRMAAGDAQKSNKTLGMMERQLTHISRLIDDLLDVSRITRGKVKLQRERLLLRAVFDSAIEGVRHLIEAGGHTLTLHLPYEPLYLDADATRLSQVLQNLLHNAAKYTPEGGKIDLYAERQGDDVVIRVEDTGVGIPGSMLSHVFDMFAQVGGSSLDRSQGGLGIGLSISKQLVEMHGGSIQAASAGSGAGSTFTVRLPLAPEWVASTEGAWSSGAQASVPSRRVLVVDDNVDAADSFATMLELSGYQVRTVYSGPDALATAAELRPTHVFCDIGMPGMNGYEVARRLRADHALSPARLVAVTGWGSAEDKRRALEAGFDYHLAKPVDWAAVEELLVDH